MTNKPQSPQFVGKYATDIVEEVVKNLLESTSIKMEPGTTLEARATPKEDFRPFQAIGPLTTVGHKGEPDIFDRLADLPQGAVKVFNEIKKHRDYKTSICVYQTDGLKTSEKAVFNRNIKRLIAKEIIKRVPVSNDYVRVRKGTYMINPVLIKCVNYSNAKLLWQNL